ncbi:MAG: SDR family oxidoreductase [Pseudomonadota bacterium]|nr:SDR family oxidoreductase [Pseudomonadota bacterium]
MPRTRPSKTTIVAGGAGFLGSHLCEMLLDRGHRVLCVDNFVTGDEDNLRSIRNHPRFSLLARDICEPIKLNTEVDRIYNLACAASPPHYQADPVHTMRTCVVGTLNLLDLAERCGARFLQASTSEVYGDPDLHPQNETYAGSVNCTGPRACYDEGKRAAEAMCFDYIRSGRADVRVARIFNTYGPRMHPNDGRVVSNLIVQALRNEPLTIYGDGSQTRSFCYVNDLLDGLCRLLEASPAPDGPVNLGNPGEFTILELAELVLEMTGSSSDIRFLPLPVDDPRRRRPDIRRAIGLLDWRPKTALRKGLGLTVEHFQQAALNLDPVEPSLVARTHPRIAIVLPG